LKKRLEAENVYLSEEIGKNYNFEEIIGTSPRLRQVFEIIETVAPTDATVLIQGETGTGKELAARAVHNRSTRSTRPLIKINCAALPRELVESELFGHERGSFTGAHERRIGKFELAEQGTIFLDEIGELPLDAQVKLLRVLQEKEIERLGGKGTIKLDLRVVAATNRNLAAEVQQGRFRADLYYRLSTVELFMPPLRERREDIEPLTLYFARKYAAKFSRLIERVSTEMLRELNAYDFPGNIRELEHIVEHAVIFSKNEKLILPRLLIGNAETNQVSSGDESKKIKLSASEPQTLSSIEREHIIEVLRQTSGRIKGKRGAAEILGLNPATVYFRMKKLGIEKV
jgi:transcriptional regulator with GAF, ATPase, and Fis domain